MTSSETAFPAFVDRRLSDSAVPPAGVERRQFRSSYSDLSPEAQELARAVDAYKLHHRRRYITYEELLSVIRSIGYHK